MSETAIAVEPALYCGTYAKYNEGSIEGKWLKLRDYADAPEFLKACRELHRDEADPELMFQDFEGMPCQLYGESLSLTHLVQIYEWFHSDDGYRELLAEYLEATDYCLDDVDPADVFDKLYCVLDLSGGLSSTNAMGQHVLEEGLVHVPQNLWPYIDVDALGRDWLMDFSVSSKGYVFVV